MDIGAIQRNGMDIGAIQSTASPSTSGITVSGNLYIEGTIKSTDNITLYTFGRDTRYCLYSDNVVFYHPCNNRIEDTQQLLWNENAVTLSEGILVSGITTTTSGLTHMTYDNQNGRYQTLEGTTSFAVAFWTRYFFRTGPDANIFIGSCSNSEGMDVTDGLHIHGQNGKPYVHINGDEGTGGSSLNPTPTDDEWHFVVLYTEISGGQWHTYGSIDAGELNHLTSQGSIFAPMSGQRYFLIHIEDVNEASPAPIIDEVIAWTGLASPFTADEILGLRDRVWVHGIPMDANMDHLDSTSNFDLFVEGYTNFTASGDMFIESTIQTTASGDMFTFGRSSDGMLRPNDVVFYHPLNDNQEYTVQSVWSGDANFVNGQIGDALTAELMIGQYGDAIEFSASSNLYTSIERISDSTFVVGHRGLGSSGVAKIGTVTGQTAVLHDDAVFAAAIGLNDISSIEEDRFVVVYEDRDLPNHGYAKVGSISGTTITFGASGAYMSDTGSLGAPMSVSFLTPSSFVVAYQEGLSPNDEVVKIGTMSGTTITFGSGYTFAPSGNSSYVTVDRMSDTKFAIAYTDQNDGAKIKGIIGTVSSSGTVDFGDAAQFATNGSNIGMAILNSDQIVVGYRQGFASLAGESKIGSVSGTTIGVGAASLFLTTQVSRVTMNRVNDTAFLVTFRDGSNGLSKLGTVSGTTITYGESSEYYAVGPTHIDSTVLTESVSVVGFTANVGNGLLTLNPLDNSSNLSSLSDVNEFVYPGVSGSSRITTCLWGNNPTLQLSAVIIERGQKITLTSDEVSLGSGTVYWNGDNISSMMSGVNDGLNHLLVLDFENTSGNDWRLNTSVDGVGFVDQGLQSSGSQSVDVTDTSPGIIISGVSTSQWIDEVVVWAGDKNVLTQFTSTELDRLYALGQFFVEPMPNYDQRIPVSSGSKSLFIEGSVSAFISNSADLYISSSEVDSSTTSLYVRGKESLTDSSTLSIEGHGTETQSASLFLHGLETINEDKTLFVGGHDTVLASGELYVNGHIPTIASGELFVNGHNTPIASGDMFVEGLGFQTATCSLYTAGPMNIVTISGNLYIAGWDTFTSSSDLFVEGHTPSNGNFDLFTTSHEIVIASGDMFIGGLTDSLNDSATLFIHGWDSLAISGDMVVTGHEPFVASEDLFTLGLTSSSDSIGLYTQAGSFDSMNLFIGGAAAGGLARPLDWLMRTSDYSPQLIGTMDTVASGVNIQVWDITNGQNALVSITSSGCYSIGDTGRWGWSTANLSGPQIDTRQYFYRMTSDTTEVFDGQFFMKTPEKVKWIHPDDRSNYLVIF